MDSDETSAFVAALVGLAETFGESLSEGRIAGYVEALEDIGLEDLLLAIKAARRSCQFFPRPSELRTLGQSDVPDEGEAYAYFARLVRYSAGFAPEMPPGLRLIVDRMGGWNAITNLDEEGQRRRFRDVFPGVRTACVTRGLALLPGRACPALTGPVGMQRLIGGE